MKKFSLFLLVAVFVIVSIPFSVHAEEVSPCVAPLGCPMDSSHNSFSYAYLDANHHVYQCDFCGYHIRTESHNFVGVSCSSSGQCTVCGVAGVQLPHSFGDITNYGNYGHGRICTGTDCIHNPASPNFIELYELEDHWSETYKTYTMEEIDGEYYHFATWTCDVCEWVSEEYIWCEFQSPTCQAGCQN